MMRLVRVLLLGAVTLGIVLAFTAAPSSGAVRGQATGYGDDVLQPCKSGQKASADCLQSLQTQTVESAGSAKDSSGNTFKYTLYGIGALVMIGGVAFYFSRTDFFRRFRIRKS